MNKFACMLAVIFLLSMAASAHSSDYRYVLPDALKEWIGNGKKMLIVDIQPPADFAKRHFKGAIETNAYPVDTDEEKKRREKALQRINATPDDIVIVCQRGGGARKTWDYLKGKGIAEERMFILEKGSGGWSYPEMCVTSRE